MKYRKIKSLDDLKQACHNHSEEFVIQLNFGLRSSKNIEYNPEKNTFSIFNYIDDSEQTLTPEEIMNESVTNIGKAINYGSFFLVEN